MRNPFSRRSLAWTAAVVGFTTVLWRLDPLVLRQIERRIVDARFRARGPLAPPGKIAVVAVDAKSIRRVGRWPWPRDRVAALLERIGADGPAVVGVDFLFSERDPREAAGDERLARAAAALGNVVFPCFFYLSPSYAGYQTDGEYRDALRAISSASVQVIENSRGGSFDLDVPVAFGVDVPVAGLAKAARIGFFNIYLGKEGDVHEIPLVIRSKDGGVYVSMAVAVARAYARAPHTRVVAEGRRVRGIAVGETLIPTDPGGTFPVNFYGAEKAFAAHSAADVLEGKSPPGSFRDKVVFVGGTSVLDFETVVTPFSPTMSSVVLYANAVGTIMEGSFLAGRGVSSLATLCLILLSASLMLIAMSLSDNMAADALAWAGLCAGLVVGGQVLFTGWRILAGTLYPLLALAGVYALLTVRKGTARQARLRRLQCAVAEVGAAIASLKERDTILDSLLDAAVGLLGASGAAVFMRPGEGAAGEKPVLAALRGLTAEEIESPAFASPRGTVAAVLESGRGTAAPLPAREGRPRGSAANALCVPVKARDRVLGALYAEGAPRAGRFSPREMEVIASFAAQAGVYLENADLYRQLQASEEKARGQNVYLKQEIAREHEYQNIVGRSAVMQRVFSLVEKAAKSDIAVLIQGETGTGKELIARAIHYRSPRLEGMFVAQNCAAIPAELLESELFGHVRGAFTGACAAKKGLFEIADGGTIFLDEIGDMPTGLQSKLLRVLDGGAFRPLGSTREMKVNVRLISATNRNIREAAAKGAFREDLYYRINSFQILLPPLRERREDIPLLVGRFIDRYAEKLDKKIDGIAREAMELLCAYQYPGNVRELENEIERAVTLTPPGDIVGPDVISEHIRAASPAPAAAAGAPASEPPRGTLDEMVRRLEKEAIARALQECGDNKSSVAKKLGLARTTLYAKMRDYGLE